MNNAQDLSARIQELSAQAAQLANDAGTMAMDFAQTSDHASPFVMQLTVFVLACFVGYYVVWKVTPALHSPLMGVTNAISSVIIVGALIASGLQDVTENTQLFGFMAIVLASINIFGGFIVTDRMLNMFKKKKE